MANLFENKGRGRFFRYAPFILWICVIFAASSTMGAMTNTSRIIRPLLIWLFPNAPEETITFYHAFIRKAAHVTEYGILAFWAARAFWGSSKEILQKYWYAAAFISVVLVASLDEYNQSFNSLRTSSPYDVLLDISGGLFMILLLAFYRFYKRR